MTTLAALNSQQAMQSPAEGRIPRFGPMLMLVARPAFSSCLPRGLPIYCSCCWMSRTLQWSSATGGRSTAHSSTSAALGLLFWLTRREGLRLLDLTGFDIRRVKTDIPLGIGLSLLIFPVTIFGGGALAQWIAYGKLNPEFPEFHGTTPSFPAPSRRVLASSLNWSRTAHRNRHKRKPGRP